MTMTREPVQGRRDSHPVVIVVLTVTVTLIAVALTAWLSSTVLDRDPRGMMRGSGIDTTQTRSVARFDSIDLAGDSDVIVHVGRQRSVVVQADENLQGRIRTTVRSGTLMIETLGSFRTHVPMRVFVAVPDLTTAVLSGTGRLVVDGISGERFEVRLTGDGALRASGTTNQLLATLSGTGDVEAQALTVRAATARLEGTGRIAVHTTASLDAVLSGTGAIVATGTPARITKSVTGTGSILVS